MPDEETAAAEGRPFDEWFREHRKGQALHEAGDVLRDLVEAVAHTGKKGTLTIKVSVAPDKKLGMAAVIVTDEITANLPTPDKDASLFFVTGKYELVRHDPGQITIHEALHEGQED